jgi:hypothetical protein
MWRAVVLCWDGEGADWNYPIMVHACPGKNHDIVTVNFFPIWNTMLSLGGLQGDARSTVQWGLFYSRAKEINP